MRALLPSLRAPPLSALRHSAATSPVMLMTEPFIAPTDWFVYGHLHFILALPTLTLLYLSPPLQTAQPLQKQAAYGFVGFIVIVGVIQSLLWDSYGATLGIWEFNPSKCTLRESFPLPVEEVLWLFHHVLKTALYQLKAFELVPANTYSGAPSAQLTNGVNAALVASIVFGVYALGFSTDDAIKCIGLVCAFFAPVWLLIWNIGGQFVLRHSDRIAWGKDPHAFVGSSNPKDQHAFVGSSNRGGDWPRGGCHMAIATHALACGRRSAPRCLPSSPSSPSEQSTVHEPRVWILGWVAPGITTTLIDCLGQQQGVWRFPADFLSGIGVGYLKLDVALVYMVSTFAVTASGAVVLAATEELLARRAAALADAEAGAAAGAAAGAGGAASPSLQQADEASAASFRPAMASFWDVSPAAQEPSLLDVGKYIFSGELGVYGTSEEFQYASVCTIDGCIVEDEPAALRG